MSESKFVMAQRLCEVQKVLMDEDIQDMSLDYLIPLIFKKCIEGGLTFWFNFFENEAVLNLRDVTNENYELNIRQYTGQSHDMDEIKKSLLVNTFLLTPGKVSLENDVLAQQKNEEVKETPEDTTLISADKVTPKPIREAIRKIQAKGVEVNKSSIKAHVPWTQLSNDQRIKCTNYLQKMGAS